MREEGSQVGGVCIIDVNPMDDGDQTDPPTRSPTPGEGGGQDTDGDPEQAKAGKFFFRRIWRIRGGH